MTTIDAQPERADLRRDPRVIAARLKLVVDSLWANVVFNPLGTLMIALTIYRHPAVFGHLTITRPAVAIALQSMSAVIAFAAKRYLSRTIVTAPRRTEHLLIALQMFSSLCWVTTFWLLWITGNAANNIMLTMVITCVVWSTAFLRSACPRVFLSGMAVVVVGIMARYATSDGAAPFLLLTHVPSWAAFIYVMSLYGSRRVDEALFSRFANEDLSHELRTARDQAVEQRWEAVEANAAKTTFLANMSHELRTPLNAILGFSEIISQKAMGDEVDRYADYARDIHSSGAHLLSLINDLLDVAKIEAGKMEIDAHPLDPVQAFETVELIMTDRMREKGQELSLAVVPNTPWPVADERAFKQIVLNLVSNAAKFTQRGGRVTVTGTAGPDGGFLLSVEDNGPGIPNDRLSKVFQPFTQIDNRYDRNAGGTGLGLTLVQGLAALHGGRAWIESDEGQGTTVFVYFPLGAEFAAGAPPKRVLSKY